MRLNVRCCCDPTIVIGTLEVPPGVYQKITIPARYTVLSGGSLVDPTWSPQETLEVGEVFIHGHRERAIKSGERPDEFWDTLKSFRRGDYALA